MIDGRPDGRWLLNPRGWRAAWEASGKAQTAERERLWLMAKLLGRVKGHLVEAMETGRLANRQIAAIEERRHAADGD